MQRNPFELTLELSRGEDAEDPFRFRYEPQEYRRHDGGKVWSEQFPWNAQLLADLGALGAPSPDPARVQRLGDALRTFLGGLGWEAEEVRLREALAEGRPVHLTCRFAAAELYSLPWELVTLEPDRRHLGELPGCLIRYEWPKTQSARSQPSPPPPLGRLLLAWSTAGGEAGVNAHLRALREVCARYEYPFSPERDVVAHVSLEGLSRTLATSGPIAALHILCHGSRGDTTYGLLWGTSDERQFVDAAALRRVLAPHAGKVRMVVLSACHGGDPGEPGNHLGSVAQALHAVGIPAVVASRLPLSVKGSVQLTETLYRELLECEPLDKALGAVRMRLALSPPGLDWASLQLYARAEEAASLRPIIFQPYRGLLTFEARHRRFFHGRKAQQRALVRRVREALRGKRPRFQVVAGASGSGKSSLVKAGLVALLKPPTWEVHVTRPGELSSEAVARLRRPREKQRLLLMVDQFEEVFTLMPEARERQAFVQALWDLARSPESNAVVLATLRFDYFERCREIVLDGGQARLDGVVVDAAHCLSVPPLQGRQLEAAIEGPARRVGLRFEGALSEVLRKDVEREPGGLPLLEYALDQLWEKRDGDTLTERTYKELGGVTGALTRTASEMYAQLSPFEQLQARRLLLALINFRDDASPDTRRRVRREQLRVTDGETQKALDAVIEKFVGKRLLVVGGGPESEGGGSEAWIELAHEELLRSWLLLSTWVKENQERGRALQRLEEWAEEWRSHQKGKEGGASYLLSGERLTFAREVQTRYPGDLSPDLERFIQASWERSEAERLRELKRQRNLRRLSVALAIGFALAVCLGGVAFLQKKAANKAQNMAMARELMANARLQMRDDPQLGMKLMLHAHDILENEEEPVDLASESDALSEWGLRRLLIAWRTLSHQERFGEILFMDVALSPDSQHVVTASNDNTARVWDVKTGVPVGKPLQHSGSVRTAAFSLDNRWVVTASSDNTARVWDVKTGEPVGEPLQHSGSVNTAAFSSDNRWVVTASNDTTARVWDVKTGEAVGKPLQHSGSVRTAAFSLDNRWAVTASSDNTARVWDVKTGEAVGKPLQHSGSVNTAAFSSDNRWVVTASDDNTARMWDVKTGEAVGKPLQHSGSVNTAAFSSDNRWVVTASDDNTARVWDARTGNPVGKPLQHSGSVRTAAFSPDNRWVATASDDNTAQVWDAQTGEPVGKTLQHSIPVMTATFSSDAQWVFTFSIDGTFRMWNAQTSQPIGKPFQHSQRVYEAVFSPDRQHVVAASDDNTAQVWDARTGEPVGKPLQHTDLVSKVAFSPNDRWVATASNDNTARVWDAQTGKPVGKPLQHTDSVNDVTFSPDSRWVVTASADNTARVWDAQTGEPVGKPLQHTDSVRTAAFSPDGRWVVTTTMVGPAQVWDTKTGEPVSKPLQRINRVIMVSMAAFSPDGRRMVTTTLARSAQVWDMKTGEPVGKPLQHNDAVSMAVFSPDGQRVITVSQDKSVQVWDTETGNRLGDPFQHPGEVLTAAFSPDGRHVVTIGDDGIARVWGCEQCAPAVEVFKQWARELTCQERNTYLHEKNDCSPEEPITNSGR
ncbi:hypothetical protein CYFUS_003328 [Cystobacter fuscus]|uniref:Uncharacterized protein n=1 Tax=Cystobacter fuscus TaxID=43 RepID=A0A250J2U9_9BACT|nr:CHAT domain-containing protein [Cystobacter fuscus]ATB37903.1 hypothetical protein CYFUS_003328 [Cystobacter fuscus]